MRWRQLLALSSPGSHSTSGTQAHKYGSSAASFPVSHKSNSTPCHKDPFEPHGHPFSVRSSHSNSASSNPASTGPDLLPAQRHRGGSGSMPRCHVDPILPGPLKHRGPTSTAWTPAFGQQQTPRRCCFHPISHGPQYRRLNLI